MAFSDAEYLTFGVVVAIMAISEEKIEEIARRTADERSSTDVQRLIRMVLSSPMYSDSDVFSVDGVTGLKDYKGKNTDVQTRIILQMALDAIKGDDKKAKLLFDYGGFAPVKEQAISVETPSFYDDISAKVEIVRNAEDTDSDEE